MIKAYISGICELANLHNYRFTPYVLGLCKVMGWDPIEVISPPNSFSYLPNFVVKDRNFNPTSNDVILLAPQATSLFDCWTSSPTGRPPTEITTYLKFLENTPAQIYSFFLNDELQGSINIYHELDWLAEKTTMITQYDGQHCPVAHTLQMDFKEPSRAFMPYTYKYGDTTKDHALGKLDSCPEDLSKAITHKVNDLLSMDAFEGVLNGCYTAQHIDIEDMVDLRYLANRRMMVADSQMDEYLSKACLF